MAEVYLATDLLLNRAVAVKILHARFAGDREFVERFRREARAAASLSHPNVVNIYDVGEDQDTHYIVLEYVKGRNLKDILRRYGPLPIRQATFVARAVAAALAAAHRQNLIHRDVKPHNILITDEGRVKVTDFGIARAASAATLTHTGTLLGSVHYFSPEQARGQPAGPQSDVYSLGVVLYEMLTGRVPFTSDTPVGVALKHLQEEPVPPSRYRRRLPERLEAIVLRAMAKDPSQRYPSPADMLADLRAFSREYQPSDEEFLLEEDEGSEWEAGGPAPAPAAATRTPTTGPTPAVSFRRASGTSHRRAAGDQEGTALWPSAPPSAGGEEELEEPTRIVSARGLTGIAPDDEDGGEGEENRRERRRRASRARWVWAAAALVLVYVGISQGAPAVMNWIFPPDVVVPDVVGLHLDEARERLRAAGLELTLERRVHHSEVPEFHIIAQSPDPHRTVKMRRAIHVTMSLGPDRAPTPDVRGMPEREARLLITQEGFVLGDVHEEFRTDAEPHTVIAQWPEPGEAWERGRPVDLWVARPSAARPRVTLPDLRGLSLSEVRTQLQALGLIEGNLWPEPAARVPPGRIIDQNPPPGHEIEVGSPVDLVYSASAPIDPPGAGPGPSSGAVRSPSLPPEPRRHRTEVSVYVPDGSPQEVVIVVIDDFGAREVYRDTVAGGTRFEFPVEARGARARVQVYLGGAMVKDTRLDEGSPVTSGGSSNGAMGGNAWATAS